MMNCRTTSVGLIFIGGCETPYFRDAQSGELLLPPVERLLADPELAADLLDRDASLRLLDGKDDLLISEQRLLHGHYLLKTPGQYSPLDSCNRWISSWVAGQVTCYPIAAPHGLRVSIGHQAQETQDVNEALEATQPRSDRAEAA
jgi:hypothetical protein